MKWQSAGGKATALILREKSVKNYYLSPNICKECSKVIEVDDKKVSQIRVKLFCSSSCSASYNNKKRVDPELKAELEKKRKLIRSERQKAKRAKIKEEKGVIYKDYGTYTKGEVFERSKNWQTARTMIRKHAERSIKNLNLSKICSSCGYSKHVELCHIKSVSSFSKDTLISDVNSPNNLKYLCPNCHWEFDNT